MLATSRQFLKPVANCMQRQASTVSRMRSRRDEEIHAHTITYVDAHGQVHPRCSTDDIISSIDRKKFFLIEVDPHARPPVCRLMDKKLMFDKQKQKTKKKPVEMKEIVFGWNVTQHDMQHKLNKAISFLDKGNKVKIDIKSKRGQKRPEKQDQLDLVHLVHHSLVDYGKLSKKPEFAGQQCSMLYEKQ